MTTNFTAEITSTDINLMASNATEPTTHDEITIYRNGEEFDTILIESSEDNAPYDAAVSEAIDGAEFTWLPSNF